MACSGDLTPGEKVNQMRFFIFEGWQLDETRRRQILPTNKKPIHPKVDCDGGFKATVKPRDLTTK